MNDFDYSFRPDKNLEAYLNPLPRKDVWVDVVLEAIQ
jgi:hypothetical protein